MNAPSRPTAVSYEPALDGWRAISILLVVIAHGGMKNIVPGGFGVTLFFFISGFLITSLLLTEFERVDSISLRQFYFRRFWRLSPPALVYISVCTLLIIIVNGRVPVYEPVAALLYSANYYSYFIGFSTVDAAGSPLNILGSLAVEEHYYIFFAPIVAVYAHTRIRLLCVLAPLLSIPPLLRCWIIFSSNNQYTDIHYIYMSTETRIDSIAWGALLAWMCHFLETDLLRRFLDNKKMILGSILILLFCFTYRAEWFRESFRYSLQGFSLLAIIYSSLRGTVLSFPRKLLETRSFVFIGKTSYSIYLYHWLAFIIANFWFGTGKTSINWLLTYCFFTVLLAYASYRLLEIPSVDLRRKYGSNVAP